MKKLMIIMLLVMSSSLAMADEFVDERFKNKLIPYFRNENTLQITPDTLLFDTGKIILYKNVNCWKISKVTLNFYVES